MLFICQVEVLQAEVAALKQLVLTSTSSPGHSRGMSWRRHSTEHLSPCPDCNSYDCDAAVTRFNETCLHGSHHAKDSLSDESEVGTNSILSSVDALKSGKSQTINGVFLAGCPRFC